MSHKLPKDDLGEDDVLASKDPQITSQDPNERKSARALRIKRRQEALKRAEQPLEDVIKDEEPDLIEQATTAAAQEIQRLALDGAAKVTNVKVTTDEREVLRRALFTDKMKDSLIKIEEEANEAQIQYEAITSNWSTILSIKDPLEIDAEMKDQKQKCDELLSQKNRLIDDLKRDLKQMDQAYYKDLEIQDNDVKELSDRIEKQITILQRAYNKQLSLIEQAISIEREAMIDLNNKRWEALYRQRDREEMAHIEYKFEKLEEHKQEMEGIMWDHHAKYREAKIELETLIQELQKELEKLKATCLINTEKIGYNYQVLKKREEENVFVRSQQKRKLNKMSDVANALRAKIRKAAEDGALEEIKADTEIVKLLQTMEEIEKKARHFAQVNNHKFLQVWRMSADRCTEMALRVREAEVCVHAHVLAEAPPPPPAAAPHNPFTKYELERKVVDFTDQKSVVSANVNEEGKDKLIRHILQLIADNTGFLVEDRLLKLLEKYQTTSRNLCTLDSIFMALEIQAQEDIDLLCTVFLNYAFCPRCATVDESSVMEQSTSGDKIAAMHTRVSAARSMSASTSRSAHVGFRNVELTASDEALITEAEEIIQKYGEPKFAMTSEVLSTEGSSTSRRAPGRGVTVTVAEPKIAEDMPPPRRLFLCPIGHNLEIEPMQVLTALNEFMTVFVPPEKKKLYAIMDSVKPLDFSTPSRKISANEISSYWAQFKDLFPPEKDRLWDGLIQGLNDYLHILQERERLHVDVQQLRERNAALRRIARGELPQLPAQKPKYLQPDPPVFIASVPENEPLPPII